MPKVKGSKYYTDDINPVEINKEDEFYIFVYRMNGKISEGIFKTKIINIYSNCFCVHKDDCLWYLNFCENENVNFMSKVFKNKEESEKYSTIYILQNANIQI